MKRTQRKIAAALAVSAAVAIGLAGCAAGGGSAADGGTPSGTIVVNSNGGGDTTWVKAAAKAFEKKYPGVHVTINAQDPSSLVETAAQVYSSSNAPDVGFLQTNTAAYPALVKAGALTKLDGIWSSTGLSGAVQPNVKPQWTTNGHQYGVVTDQVWAPVIYYDKALFLKAGITAPDGRVASLDDWDSIIAKLKAAGIQPLSAAAGDQAAEHIMSALLQTRSTTSEYADFLTNSYAGATNPARYSSGAFLAALQEVKDWSDAGVFAKGSAGMTGAQAESLFATGGAAMLTDGSWGMTEIQQLKPAFDVGWFLYPSATTKSEFGTYVGDGMVIPAKAKNPVTAKAFVEFLVGKEGQDLQAVTSGTIPIRTDLPASAVTALPAQTQEQLAALTKLGSTSIWSPSPTVTTAVTNAVPQIITGQATPQQIADSVQKTVDTARAASR